MTAPGRDPTAACAASPDARLTRGTFTLELGGLTLGTGTVAVVGPNGSGKTTLLRLLAGLEHLDQGELVVHGVRVDGPGRRRRRVVPAHRRQVAVVFQDHRLFDHLGVLDDVAFPLRRRGVGREPARRRAREMLGRVGLGGLADARSGDLSGGQRQRVALARALAAEPRLLLLDEPLASVDDASRAAMRRVLADCGVETVVVVTHDPVDVATLADHLVVLDAGRVLRSGPVDAVSRDPGSRWAADFCGANVVTGDGRGRSVLGPGGFELVLADEVDGPVHVVFGPEAVALHPHRPEGSARNVWRAEIVRVDDDGSRAIVHLGGRPAIRAAVTTTSVHSLGLRPGTIIWASVKATELRVVSR